MFHANAPLGLICVTSPRTAPHRPVAVCVPVTTVPDASADWIAVSVFALAAEGRLHALSLKKSYSPRATFSRLGNTPSILMKRQRVGAVSLNVVVSSDA